MSHRWHRASLLSFQVNIPAKLACSNVFAAILCICAVVLSGFLSQFSLSNTVVTDFDIYTRRLYWGSINIVKSDTLINVKYSSIIAIIVRNTGDIIYMK